jgi:hypothetical protein
MRPGSAGFTPLRFDRFGLAVTMLSKLGVLRLADTPAFPGWTLADLRKAAGAVNAVDLRGAVESLLSAAHEERSRPDVQRYE